jgi:hypothetical protein
MMCCSLYLIVRDLRLTCSSQANNRNAFETLSLSVLKGVVSDRALMFYPPSKMFAHLFYAEVAFDEALLCSFCSFA